MAGLLEKATAMLNGSYIGGDTGVDADHEGTITREQFYDDLSTLHDIILGYIVGTFKVTDSAQKDVINDAIGKIIDEQFSI